MLEETGVVARLLEPVGAIGYETDNQAKNTKRTDKSEELVRVKFYLMEYLMERKHTENREQRWCTYNETMRLLTFNDTKELFCLASQQLARLVL